MRLTFCIGAKPILLLMATGISSLAVRAAEPDLKLAFDKPAAQWTEAVPVGNGRIGAMVFGGVEDERLQINEDTLWGGGPRGYTDPESYSHLAEMQKLIFAGKVNDAEQLGTEHFMGQPKLLMPYQPFCDLRLRFGKHTDVTGYQRGLDLNEATATTRYMADGVEFRREVFVSYPDQVLVVRLTASDAKQLTLSIGMDSPQPGVKVESTASDTLQLTGQIAPRQNPPQSWTGSWDKPGEKFAAVLKVMAEGGTVESDGRQIQVAGANAVTIVFSNATSFRNYHDIDGDALGAAKGYLSHATQHSYPQLRKRHVEDFQRLFSRVELRLGDDHSTEPTDQRIGNFGTSDDPSLLALYFEFGRYLLISSSRPGGQPANLQGIWNQDMSPAWSSKWTTNINLEMNYWQADTGDLGETQEPLWDLIRDLRVTGAETAKTQYHSQGWVLHHNTDLWRATAPVDGPWGIWPMGEAWLANQMWDHYTFTEDREFLEQQGYPAMKEAAEFVLGFLVEAPAGTPFAGKLVTNPSTSPENVYLLNGKRASLTYASTMDLELIRELFENCKQASQVLGFDAPFRLKLDEAEKRLPPLQVGKSGALQEWIEDYPETEPKHRHVSHLYSLYPGHGIGLQTTPDYAAAAEKTLEQRGDGGTGWSTVWRVALWARLRNPEHAYNNLKILITQSTLPDMFDLCPPFQIDGNLGGPAAMTEMLVQSSENEIRILPALPSQWLSGSLKGVRVRGGGKVDVEWSQGKLTRVSVESDRAAHYRVLYGDLSVNTLLPAGKRIVLDGALRVVGR